MAAQGHAPVCVAIAATLLLVAFPASATEYFVSPTGNDGASGTSTGAPLGTFSAAFAKMSRGDTLTLMNGVYHEQLFPSVGAVNPMAPQYITIRAQNDGQAVIDGDGVRVPVVVEDYTNGSYLIFEGLVARNGVDSVWFIRKDHVILRRCSGFSASVNTNSEVFLVWGTHDVLIEDCVSSGTGRKQFLAFQANHITFRRNFAMPAQWDGRNFCGVWWPYASSFELYETSDSIVENNVGYTKADAYHFYVKTDVVTISNDQFLGNMALFAGRAAGGAFDTNPGTRPQGGDNCTYVANWDQPDYRSGFNIYPGAPLLNHVWRDNLSHGNAGLAVSFTSGTTFSGLLDRFTAFGNGGDNHSAVGGGAGQHADVLQEDLDRFTSGATNLKVERTWTGSAVTASNNSGSGARLANRYVDGVFTGAGLWPWPMESRVLAELGVSVTNLLAGIVPDQVNAIPLPARPGVPQRLRVVR